MGDVSWGSDHLEPPRKRRVPLWLMGCGGGCMFVVGALVVVGIYAGPKLEGWLERLEQPDVQWPELARVLPHDAPPEGFAIQKLPVPFVDLWMLRSEERGLFVAVFAGPSSEKWGTWLSNPKDSPFFADQEGTWSAEEGRLVVQGRELRSVRYRRDGVAEAPAPEVPFEPIPDTPGELIEAEDREIERVRREGARGLPSDAPFGGGIGIDVTPEGSGKRVLIWILSTSETGTVSDAEAKEFLAPFHVGPQR